ncbi:NAD(P)-binding domain-containing protein [Streptosporangium canum]|uniref:NAD(P)-dependent oxidoreductase n=1 Tax=Streptosporangium canum TaxID=324952 RepID=UPI00343897FF
MRDTDVTVLGLGLMGQALAGAFLKNGHATTVWNRSAGKAERLAEQGAVLASSARDAAEASPLVVVCVSDHAAVRAVLDPLGDVLAGRVLVNLTSGTSEQARATAEWAAERGITYLDGAIMAIPQVVGTADAFLLYSGPEAAYEAHEPTLRSLGAGTTYLGADHGLSSLYDVALLGIMWGTLNSFLHGAALLGTAKVEATTFAPFANRWIEAVTGFVSAYAGQVDQGAYPALDATIDTHVATVDHLIHESEAAGVNTELPRLVRTLADRALAGGQGGLGYAAMIEQFRRPSA